MMAKQDEPGRVEDFLNSIVKDDLHAMGGDKLKAYAVKRRETIASSADEPAPKSIIEALMGDRADEWLASIHK